MVTTPILGYWDADCFGWLIWALVGGVDRIVGFEYSLPAGPPTGGQAGRRGSSMDYYIYAIKSGKDGRIYVGLSKNPNKRLGQHNKGKTSSTKPWRPWNLIYKKSFESRPEARKEEKRLKSGFGKEFLKSLP